MTSIKVFPKMNKINKYGHAPIYLRLIRHRRVKYIALDVHIDPKDWNNETGKLNPGANNAEQINSYLAIKESEAENTALEMEIRSNFVSVYDIKTKCLAWHREIFLSFLKKESRNDLKNLASDL